MVNEVQEPTLGSSSNLCLSCHDGTVAPGTNVPYGNIKMSGTMFSTDLFVGTLQGMHPFNFKLPLNCTSDNLLAVVCTGQTANGSVPLVNGNVQCNTCHNPHVELTDPVAGDFLVVDNSSSALCLSCHVSQPTSFGANPMHSIRTGPGSAQPQNAARDRANSFAQWNQSVHAIDSHTLDKRAKGVGPYPTLRQNGCQSCHSSHNANGVAQLLSSPKPPVPNMDATTQACITCHNGGTALSPAIPNIFAEFGKTGHPFPDGKNQHVAREAVVLNNNRHATCVDCHDPHASKQTSTFASVPIRGAQNEAVGVSGTDGVTKVKPAENQYETCLRCHGTSAGKQTLAVYGYAPERATISGDPLNLVPQFGALAKSAHPVFRDRQSALPQPSVLKFMLNLDGRTPGRAMPTRLLCTDCHNSDDNRESGGTGPAGPHGSKFSHILERRYEFSQVVPGLPPSGGPGSTIQNLQPLVLDASAGGPYSLCAKCHDLNNVFADASFKKHSVHLKAGFSCSVCHTSHGMGSTPSNPGGDRLVSFDLRVVAPLESSGVAGNKPAVAPIAYDRVSSTCTLRCHNFNHNSNGTVTPALTGVGSAKH